MTQHNPAIVRLLYLLLVAPARPIALPSRLAFSLSAPPIRCCAEHDGPVPPEADLPLDDLTHEEWLHTGRSGGHGPVVRRRVLFSLRGLTANHRPPV